MKSAAKSEASIVFGGARNKLVMARFGLSEETEVLIVPIPLICYLFPTRQQMATSSLSTSGILGGLTIPQRTYFLQFAKRFAEQCGTEIGSFRSLCEFRDRAYQMQLDQSRDRYLEIQRTLQGSAKRRVHDISVPVVMPQVESAVAYQTGVYLSSYPIFGVVSSPSTVDAALQMETVIGQQSIKYGWSAEFIKIFRNGFKHNFGPGFVHWKKQSIKQVSTSTSQSSAGAAEIKTATVGGNCIEALDVYNCFMDFRVKPAKHHEDGEAFGWNKLMGRMAFKRFVNSLDSSRTACLKEAFESGYHGVGGNSNSALDYYIPRINPSLNINQLALTGTNWLQWAGLEPSAANGSRINYKDYYLVTHFVCRALPSDFGRQGNTPTIYYGIIVNWQYVIYVEEMLSPNDHLPVFIMQPNDDDLGYQTQSMADTALPFQDMSSALWNISLESKRRLVFDRLIYNERFINKADIDPASAVARIPLRNASQFKGDDIGKAVYQIPYREDNSSSNLQMSEMISQMADVAAGQNKVDRGQFQKGNKTKQEFNTTMQNSSARQQLVSMTIEHQFMTPAKETIKNNILLNQQGGTMLNRQEQKEVTIDPVKMREQELSFKLTDGLLPMEKLLNPELMTVFMQYAQAMPVLMTEYDVLGMFTYWLKMQGAFWVDDFKRDEAQQQQFLQQYRQTAQAGSSLPPEQTQQPAGATQ